MSSTDERSLEEQIDDRHREVFGQESDDRQQHRAQIIARLRKLAVRARGETAWKEPGPSRPGV